MLDTQEYFALAINASQNGEHHAALEHLDKVLNTEPDNAQALYLRAAEHAELGLFDRAVEGMSRALSIDPKIELAHFQLGMLLIQKGDIDNAEEHFKEIIAQSQSADLVFFAQGMIAIGQQDFASAQVEFDKGLQLPQNYPALNQVITNVMLAFPHNQTPLVEELTGDDNSDENLVFLGAYQDSNSKDD